MMRFVLGALTGLVLIGLILIALALAFPTAQGLDKPAQEATAPPPAQNKIAAPKVAVDARAEFSEAFAQLIGRSTPVSAVSDSQTVREVALPRPPAKAVQQAKVQKAAAQVAPAPTPVSASLPQGSPKDNYFAVWDDLMQRCYAVVALQQPMDETNLRASGSERASYSKPDTKQNWLSADNAFTIKVKTRKGYGGADVLRTCMLQTNRFARVDQSITSQLKDRFHDWWARERLVQGTVDQKYPYKLAKQHRWYGGLTRFGSSQGCPIKVEFSEITLGGETEASLFLTESDRDGCKAPSGSGSGGKVRVNRLPQASN